MKNILYCMLVVAIVLTQACKKKKEVEPEAAQPAPTTPVAEPISSAEYAQLKIGNYWIYQEINVDSQGNETPTNMYDSCYIASDSVIRGSRFFRITNFSPIFPFQELLRDSSNLIINSHGEVVFAANDFNTIFATPVDVGSSLTDTIIKGTYKMVDKDVQVTVPAGTFITSNFKKIFFAFPNYAQGVPDRSMNTRFAKNVGMITQTQARFLSITSSVERKLVRYHLN
jgi:hypothetical protein